MRISGGSVGIRTIKSPPLIGSTAFCISGCKCLRFCRFRIFENRAAEIRWGKKWGKIANHVKSDNHKKNQSPLSDWILWSYMVGKE